MGWKFDKSRAELDAFVAEVVRDNAHRYKSPAEWPHLWVDFWVSLFSMSYTLGHVVAIGAPLVVFLLMVT